jgi:hypothetical protein
MHLFVPSTGGRLDAILTEPRVFARQWVVLLCHPHPQYGGTMHTKAIYRSARAFQALGMATLQFNFRGVGQSTGRFDGGRGEKEDVLAAIDFLHHRYRGLRLALLGFSFGAWVGLPVGAEDTRIEQLVGLGIPLRYYRFPLLVSATKAKLIVQGSQDEFGGRDEITQWVQTLAEPKKLRIVEGSAHLFETHIPELQGIILDYFKDRYSLPLVNPL